MLSPKLILIALAVAAGLTVALPTSADYLAVPDNEFIEASPADVTKPAELSQFLGSRPATDVATRGPATARSLERVPKSELVANQLRTQSQERDAGAEAPIWNPFHNFWSNVFRPAAPEVAPVEPVEPVAPEVGSQEDDQITTKVATKLIQAQAEGTAACGRGHLRCGQTEIMKEAETYNNKRLGTPDGTNGDLGTVESCKETTGCGPVFEGEGKCPKYVFFDFDGTMEQGDKLAEMLNDNIVLQLNGKCTKGKPCMNEKGKDMFKEHPTPKGFPDPKTIVNSTVKEGGEGLTPDDMKKLAKALMKADPNWKDWFGGQGRIDAIKKSIKDLQAKGVVVSTDTASWRLIPGEQWAAWVGTFAEAMGIPFDNIIATNDAGGSIASEKAEVAYRAITKENITATGGERKPVPIDIPRKADGGYPFPAEAPCPDFDWGLTLHIDNSFKYGPQFVRCGGSFIHAITATGVTEEQVAGIVAKCGA